MVRVWITLADEPCSDVFVCETAGIDTCSNSLVMNNVTTMNHDNRKRDKYSIPIQACTFISIESAK